MHVSAADGRPASTKFCEAMAAVARPRPPGDRFHERQIESATDATSARRRASRKRTERRHRLTRRRHVRTANVILRSQYGRRSLARAVQSALNCARFYRLLAWSACAGDRTAFSSGSRASGRTSRLSPSQTPLPAYVRRANEPSSEFFFAEIGRRHYAFRRRLKRRLQRWGRPLAPPRLCSAAPWEGHLQPRLGGGDAAVSVTSYHNESYIGIASTAVCAINTQRTHTTVTVVDDRWSSVLC